MSIAEQSSETLIDTGALLYEVIDSTPVLEADGTTFELPFADEPLTPLELRAVAGLVEGRRPDRDEEDLRWTIVAAPYERDQGRSVDARTSALRGLWTAAREEYRTRRENAAKARSVLTITVAVTEMDDIR